jgi:hypothetical protein
MLTNKVTLKISALLASSLVLTGCGFAFAGYPMATPASCSYTPTSGPQVGQEIEIPLEINVSDQTPGQDEPFTISVFPADFVLPAGLTTEEANALVVVDQASGYFRAGGIQVLNPEYTADPNPSASPVFDPSFVGLPLTSVPTSSATPSPSSNPGSYEAPSNQTNEQIFMTLSNTGTTTWSDPTKSLQEKLQLVDVGLEEENDFARLVLPGIISVRCASDPKGTIRAAKAIYPNYLDNLSDITISADSNSGQTLTGTMRFPANAPQSGYVTGIVFVDNKTLINPEYDTSVSSLWVKLINATELANGNPVDGTPILEFDTLGEFSAQLTEYSNGAIDYRLGSYRGLDNATVQTTTRPDAGEYLMFVAFSDDSIDPHTTKTAFFKVTISETGNTVGVQNLSNYGLEFGSTPTPVEPAAVVSSVSPSITSVLPANVSAAGGTKVTIRGSNLLGASVVVGDKPAALVSNTDDSIEFITPPSNAGKLGATDVKLSTYAGATTIQGALTYEKVAAPVAVTKPVVRKISGFLGGSSSIIASQKAPLKRISAEAAKFKVAACVGYSGGGIHTASDRAMALNRAKAVCASLKRANPALMVRISTNATNLGFSAAARKVEIRLSH